MNTTRIFMGKTVTIRGPKLENGLFVRHEGLLTEKQYERAVRIERRLVNAKI